MRKESFDNNEIYHIYNRGVEKRIIFQRKFDYQRFLDCLLLFNSVKPKRYWDLNSEDKIDPEETDNLLVDIFAFCLMPNHFHLLLRQRKNEGISNFMQKLCTGYTMYFNKRNERVGPLFQNRFKAVRIKTDAHLFGIPHYIHANPLEFLVKNYKNHKPDFLLGKLATYRWSSLTDFIEENSSSSILNRDFLNNFFGNQAKYKKSLLEWLKDMRVERLEDVAIDLPSFTRP